jgi:hypothetical protein
MSNGQNGQAVCHHTFLLGTQQKERGGRIHWQLTHLPTLVYVNSLKYIYIYISLLTRERERERETANEQVSQEKDKKLNS